MSRSYAHIYLTIWNDPDFRSLSVDGQWLYFVMLTHPTISSCGVIEWREKRLASMADGMTVDRVRRSAWELGQRHMVAVDVDTEEALVRSFVRHDGAIKSPNQAKGVVREHAAIASVRLMELVSREVRRTVEEHPDWKGCEEVQIVAKQFLEPFPNGFQWVPDWFQIGSDGEHLKTGEPFQIGFPVPTPYSLLPSSNEEGVQGETDALVAAPASSDAAASSERKRIDDDFAAWYSRYPRKRGKADALKAYRSARRSKVSAEALAAALEAQLPEFAKRNPEHVPYPATWLRDGSWEDELNATPDAPTDPMLDEHGRWKQPRQPPAHLMEPREIQL